MSTSLKSRKTQYIVPCFMQVVLQPFLVQAHQVQAADCARGCYLDYRQTPNRQTPTFVCRVFFWSVVVYGFELLQSL